MDRASVSAAGEGTTPAERDEATHVHARSRLVQLAWVQAVVATSGSLYFSEVMGLIPCVLCWYQRIAMYPLVVVLGVGLLLRERRIHFYVLPLSLIGLAIAIYHNLLYFDILPESIQTCTAGISCTSRQLEWFGVITIPLLSLVAFSVISAALIAYAFEARAAQD